MSTVRLLSSPSVARRGKRSLRAAPDHGVSRRVSVTTDSECAAARRRRCCHRPSGEGDGGGLHADKRLSVGDISESSAIYARSVSAHRYRARLTCFSWNGRVPLYESLFRALDVSGTRYVVFGGVATVLCGYARLTADIDLIVDLKSRRRRGPCRPLAGLHCGRARQWAPRISKTHALGRAGCTTRAYTTSRSSIPTAGCIPATYFANHRIEFRVRAPPRPFGKVPCGRRFGGGCVHPGPELLKRLVNRPLDRADTKMLEGIARLKGKRDEPCDDM